MGLLDEVQELFAKYTGGTAPAGDAAAHFDQMSKSVDPSTLAQGIAAALRSNDTPPFAQLVSNLFASGNGDQKTAMLDQLLSAVPSAQRANLAGLIPGLGSALAGGTAAATVSPDAVQALAEHAEQQNPGIVDKMSELYAAHPALVKTLGSAAMMIAMRQMAGQRRL
jgi:hypothetical protein